MTSVSLPAPGAALNLLIEGPAGAIEAIFAAPRTPAARPGLALVCHPHPLYGGAMSNKVAYTLASCALQAGLYALRFNFRGVGRSAGRHDNARGETEDTVFLGGWLRGQLPGADLLLAGFSFGAFVSLNAAARLRPRALVSIAPPFGKYLGDVAPPAHPGCPWLVVHSRDDDTVRFEDTAAVLQTYQPPPQLAAVDGAGHFFNNSLPLLSAQVLPFLQSQLRP